MQSLPLLADGPARSRRLPDWLKRPLPRGNENSFTDHLLRELRLERRRITLPAGIAIASAPQTPIRGHQLGYRPKTNSYDGWDLRQWEQYFRDLAVFGTNSIELIPPRSDDAADSPHFPLPPMEMMVGMSRLADDYGLDVWVWYPALDADYANPQTVESALKEWSEVFRKLPRIDAVFVGNRDVRIATGSSEVTDRSAGAFSAGPTAAPGSPRRKTTPCRARVWRSNGNACWHRPSSARPTSATAHAARR